MRDPDRPDRGLRHQRLHKRGRLAVARTRHLGEQLPHSACACGSRVCALVASSILAASRGYLGEISAKPRRGGGPAAAAPPSSPGRRAGSRRQRGRPSPARGAVGVRVRVRVRVLVRVRVWVGIRSGLRGPLLLEKRVGKLQPRQPLQQPGPRLFMDGGVKRNYPHSQPVQQPEPCRCRALARPLHSQRNDAVKQPPRRAGQPKATS